MTDFRVIQGDCYDEIPRLEASSVDLVIADPPYGTTQIEWDDEHPPLEPLWDRLYEVGKEDCVFVFYSAQPFTTDLIRSNRDDWRYEIIWRKTMGTQFVRVNHRPLSGHENIEVFIRKGSYENATYNPQKWLSTPYRKKGSRNDLYNGNHESYEASSNGDRHPLSVLTFSNSNHNSPHPTAKPLALMRWLVRTYTNEGDRVLAPFMGSGRAGMASVMEGRNFIGIEKDPEYATDARKRIEAKASSPELFA